MIEISVHSDAINHINNCVLQVQCETRPATTATRVALDIPEAVPQLLAKCSISEIEDWLTQFSGILSPEVRQIARDAAKRMRLNVSQLTGVDIKANNEEKLEKSVCLTKDDLSDIELMDISIGHHTETTVVRVVSVAQGSNAESKGVIIGDQVTKFDKCDNILQVSTELRTPTSIEYPRLSR